MSDLFVFLERTAKALPQFLLEEEQKKMTAHFFEWKLGPKTTGLEYNDQQLKHEDRLLKLNKPLVHEATLKTTQSKTNKTKLPASLTLTLTLLTTCTKHT